MKETLEYFVRALVAEPDAVKVDVTEEDEKVIYTITVAADDVGKVIGKQGRTIKALRTLIRAGAARQGQRAEVEVAG